MAPTKIEVQVEDEQQNVDSHNNENEVEGCGKAFVNVNMEDNENEVGNTVGDNGNVGNYGGDNIAGNPPGHPEPQFCQNCMRTDPQDRNDHSPYKLIFEMVESASIQRGHTVRKKEAPTQRLAAWYWYVVS